MDGKLGGPVALPVRRRTVRVFLFAGRYVVCAGARQSGWLLRQPL
jgi:hypothetical protein